MAKKPGLTLERHREIGAELQVMYNLLLQLSQEFGAAYPFSGPLGRAHAATARAIEAINKIRGFADENLRHDVGSDQFDKSIYYGSADKGRSLLGK